MPVYEYVCDGCENQYEMMQALSDNPEETVCPKWNATKSRRIMSSFASKVVGTHKTGFQEMKAYDMLGERMDKFGKLPPIAGQRASPAADNALPPGAAPSDSA